METFHWSRMVRQHLLLKGYSSVATVYRQDPVQQSPRTVHLKCFHLHRDWYTHSSLHKTRWRTIDYDVINTLLHKIMSIQWFLPVVQSSEYRHPWEPWWPWEEATTTPQGTVRCMCTANMSNHKCFHKYNHDCIAPQRTCGTHTEHLYGCYRQVPSFAVPRL